MRQKKASDSFLVLPNRQKQPLHARNSFSNNIFWKRIIKMPLKRWLDFFFQTQSLLMDKVIKNKRDLELVTSHSSGYKLSSKYAFIRYMLSDQVWWCNVNQFLNNSKNYICKFMQVNWWHHKLFQSHWSFRIWKVWKGKEKIIKIWKSQERKKLFRLTKNIFHNF